MVNQNWVNYLKQHKDSYPLDVLKQGLLKAGATPPDIEEAVRAAALSQSGTSASAANATYSHPDTPIRHSYPLSFKEDGFFTALGLCLKTLPFIGLRLIILMGFTVASIIWFAMTAALGGLIGRANGQLGLWTFIIGFGAPAGLYYWLKHYVLYMLKMAHVAAITRLMTHGAFEEGNNQISYGKNMVVERFGELNLLLVLHSLIKGVVRTFLSTLNWLSSFLPLPGLEGGVGIVGKILHNATSYIDDAIFSYNLARGDENQWRSSKDGLVYYAQNWKPVFKTAVYALVLEYFFSFLAFILFLVPAFFFGMLIHGLGVVVVIIAILLTLNLKSAFLRPLFSTMVALSFHKAIQNQPINTECDQTLTSVSDKFRELSEKAKNWIAGRGIIHGDGGTMKTSAIAVLACFALGLGAIDAAARKPRISVTAFENKANYGECYRGYNGLGTGFQEQLITVLMQSPKIELYEREKINQIYNQEQNLINRSKTGGPRKDKFEAADFTIAGAITEFASCFQGSDTGLSVGGLLNKTLFKNSPNVDMQKLDIGWGTEQSKVAADIRVINVETGEVVSSLSAEGTKNKSNVKLDTKVYGAGFSNKKYKDTPLGQATRAAIIEAAQKILAALPDDVPDTAQDNVSDRVRPAVGGKLTAVSEDVDVPDSESGTALDKEIAAYKAVYCPNFSSEGSDVECAAVELVKKLPETKRMQIVNLRSGQTNKVGYAQLDKIMRTSPDQLRIGDYVLISDMYEDRRKNDNYAFSSVYPKALLHKCLIMKIVKSENFVQTSCYSFKEVPPTVILSSTKLLKLRDE